MLINIQIDPENAHRTKVWTDDEDLTNRTRTVCAVHVAGTFPVINIVMNRLDERGNPFVENGHVAREVLRANDGKVSVQKV